MFCRITKPPGGETSDIFSSPASTPPGTPRRVKNYMASTIFSPEGGQGSQRNGRPRREDDSFNRLFGANNNTVANNGNSRGDSPDSSGTSTPRSIKNHQKSNIIFSDAEVSRKLNGHAANGHNGINGHVISNGLNGHSNGVNGHSNGHSDNGSVSGSSSGSATPNGTSKQWSFN